MQNVGIHYWLQAKDGTRFTERMPVASTGRFTLHIRSNTGGFLGVWTTGDGAMLTPRYRLQPSIVTEFDDSIAPSVGTYVVNRDGGQAGVVLPLTR